MKIEIEENISIVKINRNNKDIVIFIKDEFFNQIAELMYEAIIDVKIFDCEVVNELKPDTRWICVNHKLPEIIYEEISRWRSKDVLILDKKGNMYVGFLSKVEDYQTPLPVSEKTFWQTKETPGGCYNDNFEIIYWMPLPNPPKFLLMEKDRYPERINLDELSYLNHDFVTVGCTDETYCTKCGEESHVVEKIKIHCPGTSEDINDN